MEQKIKKKRIKTLRSEMIKLIQKDDGAASILYGALKETAEKVNMMSDEDFGAAGVLFSAQAYKDRMNGLVEVLKPFAKNR